MVQERSVTLDIEPAEEPTTEDEVFYNTEMVTNRDISVACLAVMQDELDKELAICDALAGSGIRGLRYLQEVPGIDMAYLNDMNPSAMENIKENAATNNIADNQFKATNSDANALLSDNYKRFDYVDIDPFGSPAPYLDSTIRSLYHEAAVGVTATDLAPLFGSYVKVCERRYGSTPMKTRFSHETGLRILLKEVFHMASRYDMAFQPTMCWYERHYYRVFGKLTESKKKCNNLLDYIGYLQHCRECGWRAFVSRHMIVEQCDHCDNDLDIAGPLWTGQFADPDFAGMVVDDLEEREYGDAADLAATVQDECDIVTPYYDTHQLGAIIGSEAPRKRELIDALQEQGYRATETHFSPKGVRTDAPINTILDSAMSENRIKE